MTSQVESRRFNRTERQRTVKLRDVPPELTFITLDEIAGRLADLTELQQQILTLLREQVPKGITFDKKKTVIFAEPWKCGFINSKPYHPIHRVEIINYGPDPVHARVEIKDEESPYEITVDADEVIPVDVKKPAIKRVFFYVDKGKTAELKVIGLF